MEKLVLYRGLRVSKVEAAEIIDTIKSNGLHISEKQGWPGFIWKNLRGNLESLFENPELKMAETRPTSTSPEGELSLCFADRLGAEYYAIKHGSNTEKNTSILIKAEVDINAISIDGRDFLADALGLLEVNDSAKLARQTQTLTKIYGHKIVRYIDKIIKHPNADRMAVLDLVCNDNEIIQAHSKNQTVINGKYETIFRSAFFCKVPISKNMILEVQAIEGFSEYYYPAVTRNTYLERN
jgi:hypothetical protein